MSGPQQNANKHQSIDLDPPQERTFNFSQPKITNLGLQSHEAQFQKNYPKNIFIPLIEYLSELGYKQAYEKCVGSKSDFQGKNVVPLISIYTLVTQDWFLRNINKQEALSHLSNKILINSKIKKKLFHLLIAQLILMTDFIDVKDFKRKISREANLIAKRKLANDEIFAYPNAIIYLLHVFLKILLFHAKKKGYNKLEEEFSKMSLEDASPASEVKAKNIGSKEQYKFYVKQIVHIFGSKGVAAQNYTDVLEQVKQTILQKDKLFREKYHLVEGIPNWIHFVDCVVMRCFEHKKKDAKITNFLFNDWITDCKNRMLAIMKTKQCLPSQLDKEQQLDKEEWIKNNLQFHEKWAGLPLPLLQSPVIEAQSKKQSLQESNKAKQFSPIILSKIADK